MTSKQGRSLRYHLNTLLFLGPWLLCFGVFSAYPIAYSIYLSFTKYSATGNRPPEWVGLDNFLKLFQDDRFFQSLQNSFYFTAVSVSVTMVLAIITAILLNRSIRMRVFYRVAVFIPVVTSLFVIATLFSELYSPRGMINDLLEFFGNDRIHWLRNTDWAMPAIILMSIWASFGFYSMVILAGLQSIPAEFYELSELEGVSKLKSFFSITLPLLKPTILFALVLNTILAFQVFGEIYIMTKGGPLGATETAVYYIYNLGFSKRDMGYASATAYGLSAILAVFSILQIKMIKYRNLYKV